MISRKELIYEHKCLFMKYIILILAFASISKLYSQSFYTISGNDITMNNGELIRIVKISHDSVYSSRLSIQSDGKNFISPGREFSFLLNDKIVDGYSGWELVSVKKTEDENLGEAIKITLKGKKKTNPVSLEINYMLYPESPVIRKWISVINTGNEDIKLEALNVEDLQTRLSQVSSVVYNNYGRMKHLGRFVGDWDDPVIVVHEVTQERGMALGNEAPSILKRTAYHTVQNNIEIGLTHPGQDFPFRKWLKPGENWESPKTFICLYTKTANGFDVINNEVNEFIVKHMQLRINSLKNKPTFVYNTWYPFRTFVSDTLIRDVANAASECGIQEFIIDDGWQVNAGSSSSTRGWGSNYGDWIVDKHKFPQGLKSTFDYISSLGMKPGLWISVGSATSDSKVFNEHPEWFVDNILHKPGDLHLAGENGNFYSSCFGTDWFEYIKKTILALANDYGLAYAKLDFSVVTSAYVNNNKVSGCYATNHPYHRDHEESFIVIYERILKLFDELHKEAPDLFIDCTFETAGKLQLMDYAIARHAEGNWLSNFEEPSPIGPLRVRQMAWWRSPALPASSLVIGNLQLDDRDFELCLKSLIGTLPIVLGDPRKLTTDQRANVKKWSVWMQAMQEKYNYMNYRKDLPGFGEPKEGAFDGWMRLNFENRSGGIFGVFREGSLEDSRKVFLTDLDPAQKYIIRLAPDGKEVLRASGEKLMEEGFQITISKLHDGNIYEVGKE
jgi:alpha-galactosidase